MKKRNIFVYIWLYLLLLTSVYGQIPPGYYDAALGLSGENLRTALKTITKTGQVKLTYTPGVWNAYAYTDVKPAPDTTIIWDMYTDIPGGTSITTLTLSTGQCSSGNSGSGEGVCYAREHSLPNSWWGHFDDAAHPQYTDLHHLFPADQAVNVKKSNFPLGQTIAPTYTSNNGSKLGPCSYPGYTGTVFEPINGYKGDFARAYLYMATRYMDSLGAWVKNYPGYDSRFVIDTLTNNYKQWFIDMLLAWHNADPVSTKEINRNNAIYYTSGQQNRNPFIDHPEYVQAIWGGAGSIKPEPSSYTTNFTASNSSDLNSSITVNWTDASGTVIPDGYLIRASTIGFNQIQNPADSVPETITVMQKMAGSGVQSSKFTGLTAGTLYYFKIFPFTNTGSNINYKTDGVVPKDSCVAGPLVAWQFGSPESLGNEITYTATTNNANLNTSTLFRGNGITPTALARGFSSTSWDVSATKAGAVTNNEYIGFTINPKTGFKVALSNLNACLRRSPTAPTAYIWKYSTDGSTFTEIGTDVSFTSTADGVVQTQIDLSGIAAFQNITNSTTITFRIYAWGSTNATSTFAFARYAAGVTTNCLAVGGSVSPIGPPHLSAGAINAFGNLCINTSSGPNSFRITGTDLTTSGISIAALNGYSFSTTSGGIYTSSLSLPQNGGNFSQDIYVKFSPAAAQSYDGNIVISGGGATAVNRSVTGSGIQTVAGTLTTNAATVLGGQNTELSLAGTSGTISKWQKSKNAGIVWTDILSSVNPYSEIPDTLGSWNYRAVVKNGACAESNSNQISVLVNANTTVFTAAYNNDWNNASNWNNGLPDKLYNVLIPAATSAVVNTVNNECNQLTIAATGQLTINTSKSLSVKGELRLLSDSSGTASLIDNGNLVSASNTAECYIAEPDQYHMLGLPVANQQINNVIAPNDSLFLWNEPLGKWISYTDASFGSFNSGFQFVSGKAYAVSCPSVKTKSFSGILTTGSVNIPLTVSTGIYSGWNFIANPYPSAINWNTSGGFARTMLEDVGYGEKAIWIWNPTLANYGCFISNGVGTNGISQYIAVNQGFWVKAATPGIFNMNNSVREHASQLWLKSPTSTAGILRIKVNGNMNAYSDEVIVNYGQTNDQSGAEKMFSLFATAPNLYTKKLNKFWSINYLSTISDYPLVPLCFRAGVSGNYTLAFNGTEQLGNVVLEDLQLGIQKNILTTASYPFFAQPTDNADRFLLHFTSSPNAVNENYVNDILIYSSNSDILISCRDKIKEINVYTIIGQQVFKQKGEDIIDRRIYVKNAKAYYFVKVITENNVYTQKVYVE